MFLTIPMGIWVAQALCTGSYKHKAPVSIPACSPTKDGHKYTYTGHPQPDFYLRKCLAIPANSLYNRESAQTPVARRLLCHYCRSMQSFLGWCSQVSFFRKKRRMLPPLCRSLPLPPPPLISEQSVIRTHLRVWRCRTPRSLAYGSSS